MYRELYAKAAKERDEANARAKMLADQLDEAIAISKDTLELAVEIFADNKRLIAELTRCSNMLARLGIETDVEWIKEQPKEDTTP